MAGLAMKLYLRSLLCSNSASVLTYLHEQHGPALQRASKSAPVAQLINMRERLQRDQALFPAR